MMTLARFAIALLRSSSTATFPPAIAAAAAACGPPNIIASATAATGGAGAASGAMLQHEDGISWMMVTGTKRQQQQGRTMADEGMRGTTGGIGGGRKPRVVIIGAGMAGIAAAQKLQKYSGIELRILEASDRIGGRIFSSEFNGEGIELGATWIHGIEGSPLYEKALEIGAMETTRRAWEGQDGFLDNDVVKAEGGLEVPRELVEPVVELYKHLIQDVQEMGEVQSKEMVAGASMAAIDASPVKMSNLCGNFSLGAFLRQGLDGFLAQQHGSSSRMTMADHQGGQTQKFPATVEESSSACQKWTAKSLQEGVFKMHENLERTITSADDLYDIDLVDFNEYKEFPGEHKTIGKGYLSVVHALASELPSGVVQFGQNVEKIVWSDSASYHPGAPVRIHCKGGSVVEADHVILTVSLGVLKATTLGGGELESSSMTEAQMNATKNHSSVYPSKVSISEMETKMQKLARESDNNVQDENHTPSSGPRAAELFTPALPVWKLDSISRLGFGTVDKVFMQVEPMEEGSQPRSLQFIFHPHPREGIREEQEEQCCTDVPPWIRKTYSLYPIHKNSHVLVAWFAGREALQVESLTDEEILSGISKTLTGFGIPENQQGAYHAIRRSRWGQNPLFRGSYSYVKVGSTGEDIDKLAEPLPKQQPGGGLGAAAPLQLLFAGEATDRHYYSTTHGAYFSGCREAERLLEHYGLLAGPLY